MWYIEVWVAEATYHKDEPLTYRSPVELEPGRVVIVPLQHKQALGIVSREVAQPKFATKEIADAPDLPPLPEALQELLIWLRDFYPAPLGMVAQLFLPGGLPRRPFQNPALAPPHQRLKLPPLTRDQQSALAGIITPGPHLLHGETGTGKTRIYLELAMRSFNQGKSSIILTPEIGLTSQLAAAFKGVFGDRVILMHSGLGPAVRRRTWQQLIQTASPVIVIGARSALFSPLREVGLIVIDESHETSYKQDQAPYYHATNVAAKLAGLHKATLILGSATPLVSDYYVANAKKRPVIRMTQVAAGKNRADTSIEVVDLKDRAQFTKSAHLSDPLLRAIKNSLLQREQVLLFLNRRGTARVIFCENCGWQALCPHCDLPLIYHQDYHLMRCHSCSFKASAPSNCPECKGAEVIFRSVGTKAIAAEAGRLFPGARVMRFDTDNKKNERLETHYQKIRSGDVDILVGTQTLAKGLDLPSLGLVGIVLADTSLYLPDFSAKERTYQLLSQVIGRVGRGHRPGMAVIQTYTPSSPLLNSVITKEWGIFYNNELAERQHFSFPPFCYILKLSCRRASDQKAQQAAEQFSQHLRSHHHNITTEGPAPAYYAKIQNKFVWQLILKSKHRKYLTDIIRQLPSGWSYDIDPLNLL